MIEFSIYKSDKKKQIIFLKKLNPGLINKFGEPAI